MHEIRDRHIILYLDLSCWNRVDLILAKAKQTLVCNAYTIRSLEYYYMVAAQSAVGTMVHNNNII